MKTLTTLLLALGLAVTAQAAEPETDLWKRMEPYQNMIEDDQGKFHRKGPEGFVNHWVMERKNEFMMEETLTDNPLSKQYILIF